jgi:hypothetical protein
MWKRRKKEKNDNKTKKCEKNENKNNLKNCLKKTLFDNWPRHDIGQFSGGSCKNRSLCISADSYM